MTVLRFHHGPDYCKPPGDIKYHCNMIVVSSFHGPGWLQPRQHEADQRDGVLRFIETHLKDQPRPQPTDQRFRWLARLASLCFKFGLSNLASLYLFIIIIG